MAEPRSPEWWVDRLNRALDDRRSDIAVLDRYYRGDHPLPVGPKEAQEAFRRFLRQSRSNWMGLVVDAVGERLGVVGFRLGSDPQGDDEAWAMWQANGLDVGSEMVHTDALVCGESYVTVAPNPDDETPLMLPEHASQVIVARDPARRQKRLAAFKKWLDDDEYLSATLYLPDSIHKYRSARKARSGESGNIEWVPRVDDTGEAVSENPVGVVPVVPFTNRQRLLGGGMSEIADVLDTQDRINVTLFNRMMALEYGAFRQRWVAGLTIETDPDTGLPRKPFEPAVDRVWAFGDAEVKVGEFGQTGTADYTSAVEADIQHIAAQTRTPPHYLLGQSGAFPSGESLKATETGLVAKVMRRQRHFGEAWEEVVRLGFLTAGNTEKADVTDSETIWRDPESRSQGELVDALVKMDGLGVPREVLWERWGASPQEVARWKAEEMTGQLLQGAFAQEVPSGIEPGGEPPDEQILPGAQTS